MTILLRRERIQNITRIPEEQNTYLNRIKTSKKRAAYILVPGETPDEDEVHDRSNKFGSEKVYVGSKINCPKLKAEGIEWTN